MAYTTINKSTDYFNTKLYTGNSTAKSITGVGFQPDFVWFKHRTDVSNHRLFDAVRGAGINLVSNNDGAEIDAGTGTDGQLRTFDADGFSIGTDGSVNATGNVVAWNWKANGAGSANTDGSINTTATSVNTTAGISISKYVGTGSVGTIGHGLGAVPKMLIFKDLAAGDWYVHHTSTGVNGRLILHGTNAVADNTAFLNQVLPTSTLITLGTAGQVNDSGHTFICYAFADKTGYSKFGSYTGNGNANGTFIYTGFKPAFILVKNTQQGGDGWFLWDNKRTSYNIAQKKISPDSNAAEVDNAIYGIDILSNGFKLRASTGAINNNGEKMIYMAFGQTIVGTNNIPATAR